MHSYIPGHDPRYVERMDTDTLAMNVHNTDIDAMKQIVGFIKSWLPAATKEYNKQIRLRNQQARDAENQRIREEIKRRKRENEIRDALKDL